MRNIIILRLESTFPLLMIQELSWKKFTQHILWNYSGQQCRRVIVEHLLRVREALKKCEGTRFQADDSVEKPSLNLWYQSCVSFCGGRPGGGLVVAWWWPAVCWLWTHFMDGGEEWVGWGVTVQCKGDIRGGTIYCWYIVKPEITALLPSYLSFSYHIGKKNALLLYQYRIMKKEVNYCIVIVLVKQKKPWKYQICDTSGFSDIVSFLLYRKEH